MNKILNLPIFLYIDSRGKLEISKILHFFSAAPSTRLIEKNKIFFLLKGQIEAQISFDNKNTYSFQFNPGEIINEIAFYNDSYPPESLTCINEVSGYYIDPKDFKIFENQNPQVAYYILRFLLKNISRKIRKINDSINTLDGSSQQITNGKTLLQRDSLVLTEAILQSIRELPFFQAFTNEEFNRLMFDMKKWSISSGTVMFSEGEQGTSCFILVKGKVEVSIERNDEKFKLATFLPGKLFGEIALVHLGLRSARCTALEDIVVLELSKKDFERQTDVYSPLAYKLLKNIGLGLIDEYVHMPLPK